MPRLSAAAMVAIMGSAMHVLASGVPNSPLWLRASLIVLIVLVMIFAVVQMVRRGRRGPGSKQ